MPLDETGELELQYRWCDVYYQLDDDDDFAIFVERHSASQEVAVLVASPSIPTSNPSIASVSSVPPSAASYTASSSSHPAHSHSHALPPHARRVNDAGSVYSNSNQSSYLYGRADAKDLRSETSMHLVTSAAAGQGQGQGSVRSARTGRSGDTAATLAGAKTLAAASSASKRTKSLAPTTTVPEHKIKFEEFHNQASPPPLQKGFLHSTRGKKIDQLSLARANTARSENVYR